MNLYKICEIHTYTLYMNGNIYTVYDWNKLSADCVTASSVNMFKNKVATYLRRADYR